MSYPMGLGWNMAGCGESLGAEVNSFPLCFLPDDVIGYAVHTLLCTLEESLRKGAGGSLPPFLLFARHFVRAVRRFEC